MVLIIIILMLIQLNVCFYNAFTHPKLQQNKLIFRNDKHNDRIVHFLCHTYDLESVLGSYRILKSNKYNLGFTNLHPYLRTFQR